MGTAEDTWKALVRDRQAVSAGARQPGYWDSRAPAFGFAIERTADPFLEFLEPWLTPARTALDVGAGTGRHAAPLADRLDWVTVVEPSDGMRARIPARDNMTVIASDWMDAEPQRADLVICSHVLYGVEDVVPFLAKLEAHARERVFVYLREGQTDRPVDRAWARWGPPRPRMPELGDLLAVLAEMGVEPQVEHIAYTVNIAFPDLETAVEEVRSGLGEHWPAEGGPEFVASLLEPAGDALVYRGRDMRSGVVHWAPRT